ncbi:cupin domain-containing protein [Roseomonas gilardii]|uniref:cupin domain-containing protein n=1 Tax=Roseomonas gilardii TaxID=257708 RepID=UPI0011A65B03|nr:cupin domain-containing protein [Roseomonas gilardii]
MSQDRRPQALGAKLREIRRRKGLTLDAVSRAVGISAGFLSLVENNKTDITFSRLSALATFYRIDLHGLMPHAAPALAVLTRRDGPRDRIFSQREQVEFAFIAPHPSHAMVPLLVTIEPGGRWGEPSQHAGQEIAYCLEGMVDAVVDGRPYGLQAGDSLYFEGMVPHSFGNPGMVPARLLCVMNAAFTPMAEEAPPQAEAASNPSGTTPRGRASA